MSVLALNRFIPMHENASIAGNSCTTLRHSAKKDSLDRQGTAFEEETIWQAHPAGHWYRGHWILGVLLLPLYGLGLLFILFAIVDRRTKLFTITN